MAFQSELPVLLAGLGIIGSGILFYIIYTRWKKNYLPDEKNSNLS